MNRRRKSNPYLLDVKVQTEGRLRHRTRWITAILAAIAVVSFSSYGVYRLVKYSAAKMIRENPRFTIAQIEVKDDGALTPQQVTAFAGVAVGQNLLSLDLDQVRRNLEMLPLMWLATKMLPSVESSQPGVMMGRFFSAAAKSHESEGSIW